MQFTYILTKYILVCNSKKTFLLCTVSDLSHKHTYWSFLAQSIIGLTDQNGKLRTISKLGIESKNNFNKLHMEQY